MSKAAAAAPESAAEFRYIPIGEIHESPWNPRKHYPAASMVDLVASILAKGVITPLILRPNANGFEIAAGHRRFRAAQTAGLVALPGRVRELSDQDFLEVLTIENLQREDIHPLDEADGYAAILKADKAYTVDAIAAKVGKSASYIYQRLKLTELIFAAREAYERDEITAGHAIRLARLTPSQQDAALPECFYGLLAGGDGEKREPAPLSKLDRWIEKHDRVDVAAAETQHYFPEVAAEIAQEAEPEKLLQLSESHTPGADLGDKKSGILGAGRWTRITGKKNTCPNAQKGVVVHGGPMRVLEVCATKGCPKHFPAAPKRDVGAREDQRAEFEKRREEQEAENRKREEEREAWAALKPVAIQALADHLKGVKLDVAQIRFCLSHDEEVVELIGALTPGKGLQAIVLDTVLGNVWSRDQFLKAVKPFKFNLAKVEQAMKAKPAAKAKKKASR